MCFIIIGSGRREFKVSVIAKKLIVSYLYYVCYVTVVFVLLFSLHRGESRKKTSSFLSLDPDLATGNRGQRDTLRIQLVHPADTERLPPPLTSRGQQELKNCKEKIKTPVLRKSKVTSICQIPTVIY